MAASSAPSGTTPATVTDPEEWTLTDPVVAATRPVRSASPPLLITIEPPALMDSSSKAPLSFHTGISPMTRVVKLGCSSVMGSERHLLTLCSCTTSTCLVKVS